MVTLSELAQVAAAAAGDSHVLEELVELLLPLVKKEARYFGRVPDEEVVAAVLRGIWRAARTWRPGRSAFHTWAVRLAKQELVDVMGAELRYRTRCCLKEQMDRKMDAGGSSPDWQATVSVALRTVRRTLGVGHVEVTERLMSDRCRREAAEELGIPVDEVYRRVEEIRALRLEL